MSTSDHIKWEGHLTVTDPPSPHGPMRGWEIDELGRRLGITFDAAGRHSIFCYEGKRVVLVKDGVEEIDVGDEVLKMRTELLASKLFE